MWAGTASKCFHCSVSVSEPVATDIKSGTGLRPFWILHYHAKSLQVSPTCLFVLIFFNQVWNFLQLVLEPSATKGVKCG